MERITVTLPEEMNGRVEAQISEDAYGNTSEYFRALIYPEREGRERRAVAAKVLEGLRNGLSMTWTAKENNKILDAVKRKADATKRAGERRRG